MRSLWSGALNVGLVNIPVSLVTAYSHRGVEFRLMHKKCKTRISYGRHCPKCRAEVEWDDVVRAYEYKRNKFVVMGDDDLKKVDPKLAKMIEIREFIDAEALDPIYVSNVYHVVPDKNAAKAYFLLHEVMRRARKVALAKMIMRDKEQWVAVRAADEALQLIDLHFADEVIPASRLDMPKKPVLGRNEAQLAARIVGSLTRAFRPERYKDEYETKLKRLVAKKVKGKKIVVAEPKIVPTIDDLTSALEKSMRAPR